MVPIAKTRIFFCIVLMLVFTLLTYSNHFNNAFHFDDSHSVEGNTYIRSLKNVPLFFKDGSTSSILPQNQSYRPVVSTSLAFDYWLGNGYNLFYFHLSSFILFLLQGLLMFMLYKKVYNIPVFKTDTAYVAVIATAWYLLHPAIAETVNYVIARSDLQSTFCVLLGLVLYIYSPFCKRTFLYLLPVAAGALAKPPAVMFAPLLFLYILFFEQQLSLADLFKKSHAKQIKQLVIKTLPSIIFCGFLYALISKLTPKTWEAGGSSVFLYLITQPFVILHYFGTLFLPTGLSADSDWGLLSGIADIRFFVGTAFVLLMLLLAFYTSKKQVLRPISYGILWFFIALVPTSTIIPLAEVLNDHRMYFPFVGLVMSVGWVIALGISKLMKKYQHTVQKYTGVFLVPIFLLLPVYAYGTYERNKVWHSEESLWYDVTIKSPLNGRGLMNYGLTKMNKGEYDVAEVYFNRALQFLPNYSLLYTNIGALKWAQGDKVTAEVNYQKSLQLGEGYPDNHYFYALFLNGCARYSEAVIQLNRAIELSPSHLRARLLLMDIYQQMGDWVKLKQLAENTLTITPGNADVLNYLDASAKRKNKLQIKEDEVKKAPTAQKYLDLSLSYYQVGKYEQCITAAEQAIKLKPGYAEAYNNMGSAYILLKQYNKAIEVLKKAIELKPDFQLAKNNLTEAELHLNGPKQAQVNTKMSAEEYINLSLIYFNQGQYQQCIDICYKSLALKPGYDLAYNNICAAYNKLGQWDKAIKAGEEGIKLNPGNQLMKNNLAESYKLKKSAH